MKTLFIIPLLTTLLPSLLYGQTLSLAGEWKFALDPRDSGLSAGPQTWTFPDTIQLPGSTAAQKKGELLDIPLNLEKPAMQHLHQRYPYIGPAWYQREITIPQNWAGQELRLTLERTLWESRVWIDGTPAGEPQNSLVTPHRYDLTSFLTPGQTHTLTLRIDNRQLLDIGSIGHSYTEETQTIWNGVIGTLTLEALPKVRVSHLTSHTKLEERVLTIDLEITNTENQPKQIPVEVKLTANDKNFSVSLTQTVLAQPGITTQSCQIKIPQSPELYWSEHNPTLLKIEATIDGHSYTRMTGLRQMTAEGRHLLINGQRTFLRGNLECAIFPKTGHPDASGEQWEKIMEVSRNFGLNHLRFHSWCPPDAAFAAADRHGIYLQVELPNWSFAMGKRPAVDAFFKAEGERLIREYGHHPSFVLFSLGNELKGDLNSMDQLISHFRELASHLIFTSTSYAFSPRGLNPGPEDNFFISQKTESGWVRGQGFLNVNFPTSNSDYSEGLSCLQIPLVTHEVGQYVVYPNLAELPKYESTPLRSTALEAIQSDLKEKDLLGDSDRFTRDSGKLAALLYKEDIERALRTPDLAGIQLLQLQDFPGQSTATVGLLDSFWDSKGVIDGQTFRQFCSPTVPLCRLDKFVWTAGESLTADFELAHFGSEPLLQVSFQAKIQSESGEVLTKETFSPADFALGNGQPIGSLATALPSSSTAQKLELIISLPGTDIQNSWPLWVYPSEKGANSESSVSVHRGTSEECLADLQAGKKVLLLPPPGALRKPLPARFIPVFWSPLHFPNQPGTLGATIDSEHPLWKNFPTDTHTNWQWWELTAQATALDISGFKDRWQTPFRFIDKYNRNAIPAAILETNVGSGKLLVCTLDVESDARNRIVARQLKSALLAYAASEDFAPECSLSAAQLTELIDEKEFSLTSSAAHPDYSAALATDGNKDTIWHSPWGDTATLPVSLTFDLLSEKIIGGIEYTPRQSNENGRIRDYQIQVSKNGDDWIDFSPPNRLKNSSQMQVIPFSKPIQTRYLRLKILSEHHGKAFASCAELRPIPASVGDSRELGIIPGFNNGKEQ